MFAVGAGVDYRYDKVHLVPVGELLPAWLAWLAAHMSVQYGALLPGAPAQPPLVVQGIRVGVSICYENQFEDYLAGQARTADMLLVASNFAWGRGSHAALGHLQASRLRAIETGRWVMQVSNGGATALVDPQGRIQAMLEPGSAGLLDVRVPAMTGSTPFVRHGNAPLLALAMTLLAGAAWHALRRGAGVRPRVAWRGD
jgi:apolipoprotein N-acyltransferase